MWRQPRLPLDIGLLMEAQGQGAKRPPAWVHGEQKCSPSPLWIGSGSLKPALRAGERGAGSRGDMTCRRSQIHTPCVQQSHLWVTISFPRRDEMKTLSLFFGVIILCSLTALGQERQDVRTRQQESLRRQRADKASRRQ
jgi:hypothetical protein